MIRPGYLETDARFLFCKVKNLSLKKENIFFDFEHYRKVNRSPKITCFLKINQVFSLPEKFRAVRLLDRNFQLHRISESRKTINAETHRKRKNVFCRKNQGVQANKPKFTTALRFRVTEVINTGTHQKGKTSIPNAERRIYKMIILSKRWRLSIKA